MSKGDTQVLDFEKICRLCLMEKRSLSAIFSKKKSDSKVPLPIRIMTCASLELYEGDGLPASICGKCLLLVNQSFAFREQCEQSDTTLRQYLQEKSLNTEPDTPSTSTPPPPPPLPVTTLPEPTSQDEPQVPDPTTSGTVDEEVKQDGRMEGLVDEDDDCSQDDVPLSKILKQVDEDVCQDKPTHVDQAGSYVCDICDKHYLSKSSLKKHRVRHTDPQHLCSKCGKSFHFVSSLRDHAVSCNNSRSEECPVCGSRYNNVKALKRHMLIHANTQKENSEQAQVEELDIKGEDVDIGTNKLETSQEDNRYDPSCFALVVENKKNKKNRKELNKSKNNKTKKETTCDVCKETFYNETDKHEHLIKKHMNDSNQFICDFCNKPFKTKAILKDHRKKHLTDPEYLCVRCGKLYYSKGHLTEHNLYCLDEKKFECPICKKRFNVNKQFRRHFIIHEAERYIKCTVCDQTFSRRDNYRQHFRRHTGEKPYTCDVCGKSFRIKATYNYHKKTHRGMRPGEIFKLETGELARSSEEFQQYQQTNYEDRRSEDSNEKKAVESSFSLYDRRDKDMFVAPGLSVPCLYPGTRDYPALYTQSAGGSMKRESTEFTSFQPFRFDEADRKIKQ